MSVTHVEAIPDSNSCVDTDTKRTYTASFRVRHSAATDGFVAVLAAMTSAGYSLGSGYSFNSEADAAATLKTRTPRRVDGTHLQHIVTCTWETADLESNEEQDSNGEPTVIPYEYYGLVETDDVIMQRPVQKAIIRGTVPGNGAIPIFPNGTETQICNSAGEIKDPPPMMDIPFTMLRMQKNFQSFNANIARAYKSSVNSDQCTIKSNFLGFALTIPKYCGRIMKVASRYRRSNGYAYWEITTEILITPPEFTWRHLELDEGMFALAREDDADGEGGTISGQDVITGRVQRRRVRDTLGQPVAKKVLFDGQGQPARIVGGKFTTTWIEFSIYRELPWEAFIPAIWIP